MSGPNGEDQGAAASGSETAPASFDALNEAGPKPPRSELFLRIVSGVFFAALAFALLWAGLLPFAGLVLAVVVAMAWEWGRIVREGRIDATLVVTGLAVAAATALSAIGAAALGLAVLVTATIIVLALEFGGQPILSATGVLYAGLPAVALLWLRGDEPKGFFAVLFIIVVVAATDTAAYAAGRLIGGPKLAPRVSPKKTWSGLVGGVSAGALAGAAFAQLVDASPYLLTVLGLCGGLIAQAGDLAESALKRAFGQKDASNLIPGHGGFMDRVDGLVTAAIAAALFSLFVDPQSPARALFTGF